MTDTSEADHKYKLCPLPTPVYSRPAKQAYDGGGRALVIDNGSYHFRIGWAGEDDPRLTFRNQIYRPRDKVNHSAVTVVGEWGLGIKGYDNSRPARDAFDGGVVCNFETQEYVLDYAFERLSIRGGAVRHPVLITEIPLAPKPCRAGMAELLFEAYGIPSLHFAIDSVCAYLYCVGKGRCSRSGLVVGSGHSSTHVIPMFDGKPVLECCNRMRPCGSLATDQLARTLTVKHPQHALLFNNTNAQLLKEQFSYTSPDYREELGELQKEQGKAESQGVMIQLPWKPDKPEKSKEEAEAEAARKAARLENNRQRLKDLAEQRKNKSIQEKEGYLEWLSQVAQQVEETDSQEEANAILAQAGVSSVKELEKAIQDVQASLRRLRGEEPKNNSSAPKEEQVFDLVDIPDAELSPKSLKEKRKQKMLKGARDARELRKQAAEQEREIARQKAALEEERLKHDPVAYLEHIKQHHKMVAEKIQARKRRRLGAAAVEAPQDKRTSADQRTRMRLIAQAAFDKGPKEGDDDFGRDDKDWEVYKQMDRNFSDSDEAAEDEKEYARTAAQLEGLGAKTDVVDLIGGGDQGGAQQQAPLTAEDFQIWLGVERLLGPELLFQPSLAGIDQAGLTEVITNILRRLPQDWSDACASGTVLLTGGNAAYTGLDTRLYSELLACRPFGQPMQVVRSFDCMLDAWRGASMLARKSSFFKSGISRADYEEKGPDYLGLYKGPNELVLEV